MYQACYAKFMNHDDLRKNLLDTGDATLVEASPFDKIWGIGLAPDNVHCNDPANWKGMNLLGKTLMKVREDLRSILQSEPSKIIGDAKANTNNDIAGISLTAQEWKLEGIKLMTNFVEANDLELVSELMDFLDTKVAKNLNAHPTEEKYRKLSKSSKLYSKFLKMKGLSQLMEFLGFAESDQWSQLGSDLETFTRRLDLIKVPYAQKYAEQQAALNRGELKNSFKDEVLDRIQKQKNELNEWNAEK